MRSTSFTKTENLHKMNKKATSILTAVVIACTFSGCSNRTDAKPATEAVNTKVSVLSESDAIANSNLSKALRFVNEGLQKGDTLAFNELVDTAVIVTTGLKPGGPIQGLAEYKSIFTHFITAWPGMRFTIDESFAVGDKVVVRFTSVNVFEKEFFGMKPTHQVASLKEVHLMTFKNGKIVSNIVSATNLEYEYILYPLLKDAVLAAVATKN